MEKPKEILRIFEKYIPLVDEEIKSLLKSQESLDMYKMMSYFFGYSDENFRATKNYGGKRFRSGICLLLADIYGKKRKALEVATAIEIFHNFTLIHDDIEDRDPIRRGRPTVWKLWGINHGINTGDAQLILANLEIIKGAKKYQNSKVNIQEFLNKKFLEVAEGQFLDLSLSGALISDPSVTEKNYLKMITKKSGVLVGAAVCVAGMIAGKSERECSALWDYGLNLGLAYQLSDDFASIWGSVESTGKLEEKDIIERKKTLPIIYAYNNLSIKERTKFAKIYDQKNNLSRKQAREIREILLKEGANIYVWRKIQKYQKLSLNAVNKLSISEKDKKLLNNINQSLIPDLNMKGRLS